MYCENFQDKSLSKGEFWSFTMALGIVELSDKECGSNSILSVVTKGPGLFDLWSQHCFTLGRPSVTLRKAQYTWQEKSRKGKKGSTKPLCTWLLDCSTSSKSRPQLWAWTFTMLTQLLSEWYQAQLCPLKPEMAGKEVSGWPWQASSPLFFPVATIFHLENLTLLWPMPQTQRPLNDPQII